MKTTKTTKKLISLLLTAVFLLTLAGCSSGDPRDSAIPEVHETPVTSAETPPATEPTPPPEPTPPRTNRTPSAAQSARNAILAENCTFCNPPPPPERPAMPAIPDFGIEGVAWFVEPRTDVTLIHYHDRSEWVNNGIHYHSWDDAFWSWGGTVMDERTMQSTENYVSEGGMGGISGWHYDPNLNLFGYTSGSCSHSDVVMHPIREFAERFPFAVDMLIVVNKVDSTRRSDDDMGAGWDSLTPEAFSGEIALFRNGRFITEFERHNISNGYSLQRMNSGRLASVAAFERNGKFGVINRHGSVIVPFVLDEIQVIDDYTAFARVGEYHWGIITWIAPEDVPHRESNGGNPPYGEWPPPCTIIWERVNVEKLERLAQQSGHMPETEWGRILFEGRASDVFLGLEREMTFDEFNEMFGTTIDRGASPHWMGVLGYYNDNDRSCPAFGVSMEYRRTISPDTPLQIMR
jgi:hypothetical protein